MSTPITPAAESDSWLLLPDQRQFPLAGRCTVGRQADNDLVIDAPSLSRHHALFSLGAGGFTLTDLHSKNGTFVNRSAITRPVALRDGDELRFGEVIVRFRSRRRLTPTSAPDPGEATQQFEQKRTRECWLLLADVEAYTSINEQIGSDEARRVLREWVTGARPFIEKNGGHINGYFGDAIFAYWPCSSSEPEQVLTALQSFERYRPTSPLPFSVVLHQGNVIFSRGDRGEEMSGQDVNFVFRIEKLAKGFGARAMLSETAMRSLMLDGLCESYGRSAIDGMNDFFVFYGLPRDLLKATFGQ